MVEVRSEPRVRVTRPVSLHRLDDCSPSVARQRPPIPRESNSLTPTLENAICESYFGLFFQPIASWTILHLIWCLNIKLFKIPDKIVLQTKVLFRYSCIDTQISWPHFIRKRLALGLSGPVSKFADNYLFNDQSYPQYCCLLVNIHMFWLLQSSISVSDDCLVQEEVFCGIFF